MDAININGVGATKQPHDFDEEQEVGSPTVLSVKMLSDVLTWQDPSRAMLEDEMPLPTDIRIETGMVKILKAGFGVESSCFGGRGLNGQGTTPQSKL